MASPALNVVTSPDFRTISFGMDSGCCSISLLLLPRRSAGAQRPELVAKRRVLEVFRASPLPCVTRRRQRTVLQRGCQTWYPSRTIAPRCSSWHFQRQMVWRQTPSILAWLPSERVETPPPRRASSFMRKRSLALPRSDEVGTVPLLQQSSFPRFPILWRGSGASEKTRVTPPVDGRNCFRRGRCYFHRSHRRAANLWITGPPSAGRLRISTRGVDRKAARRWDGSFLRHQHAVHPRGAAGRSSLHDGDRGHSRAAG